MTMRPTYWVSGIRRNLDQTIGHLRVHQNNGRSVGKVHTWSRQDVVQAVQQRSESFTAIYATADRIWREGEDVRLILVNNLPFLRIDANEIANDNLGRLPEY